MRTTKQGTIISVKVDAGNSYPRLFCWQSKLIRVLAVDSIRTLGAEQRYRVRTAEGNFELAFFVATTTWHMRRTPTRLGRAWVRWQYQPRFPLPPARWRTCRSRSGYAVACLGTMTR